MATLNQKLICDALIKEIAIWRDTDALEAGRRSGNLSAIRRVIADLDDRMMSIEDKEYFAYTLSNMSEIIYQLKTGKEKRIINPYYGR